MAASTMKSGVRKSGWPMPRLMMSRPWAANALARASTVNAFSSPIRSKFAMVFSMFCPCGLGPTYPLMCQPPCVCVNRASILPGDLHVRHFHHLEDDGDRPADQQEAVERRD